MFKVNLQNELVKQNKSLVTARELLLIKEYDRTAQLAEDKIIKRVFGGLPAAEGGRIKKKNEGLFSDTKNFKQENVFHISQIESLCKKYHLRFLPSPFFKGEIDEELPSKISQFEIAYGVDCKEWEEIRDAFGYGRGYYKGGNTYIAAPETSFNLQQKPKDPLMFFEINHEYYYLIHKWGNDLNIVRRFYKALSSWVVSMLVLAIPILIIAGYLAATSFDGNEKASAREIISLLLFIGLTIFIVAQFIHREDGFSFVKPNDWRSHLVA